MLIELSAKLIAEQMPACREVMDVVAKRFNATTEYRWGRIIDFLKLHYVLTQADATARSGATTCCPRPIPDRLQELLLLWNYQSPWFHDEFDRVEEVFPAASYQYVLYGMGFRTEVEPDALSAEARAAAERPMRENAVHDRAAARRACRATASSSARSTNMACSRSERGPRAKNQPEEGWCCLGSRSRHWLAAGLLACVCRAARPARQRQTGLRRTGCSFAVRSAGRRGSPRGRPRRAR